MRFSRENYCDLESMQYAKQQKKEEPDASGSSRSPSAERHRNSCEK